MLLNSKNQSQFRVIALILQEARKALIQTKQTEAFKYKVSHLRTLETLKCKAIYTYTLFLLGQHRMLTVVLPCHRIS